MKLIRTEQLKNPQVKEKYKRKINDRINELRRQNEWQEIKHIITKSAEEELGTKLLGGSKKKRSPWWNEGLKNLGKNKARKLRAWLKRRTPESRQECIYISKKNGE